MVSYSVASAAAGSDERPEAIGLQITAKAGSHDHLAIIFLLESLQAGHELADLLH